MNEKTNEYEKIIDKLAELNQFIMLSDRRVLNILNGSEVNYGENFHIKWGIGRLTGGNVMPIGKVSVLELHQAEYFLQTMIKQSKSLD